MPRKRYSSDEALLQAVVDDLQSDRPTRYEAAVRALLGQGPLRCVAFRPELMLFDGGDAALLLLLRAVLWAFVRELVRLGPGVPQDAFGNGIWLRDSVRLVGNTAGDHVTLGVEATRHDAAILQLAFLADRVGLGNLRLCGVWDCPRVFVKTYRREFCSARCQKRHYMRKRRAEQQEQRRRRKQQRRLKGVSV